MASAEKRIAPQKGRSVQGREASSGAAFLDLLMDQSAAVFLHQSQTEDQLTFSREIGTRSPFAAPGELPCTDPRAAWTQWIDRAVSDRDREQGELAGPEAPQPHTMCVLPGTTVRHLLNGDPSSTGVCLPHAVTAASGGGRQAALARHRGNGEEQTRIKAVFARLQRSGATHLAACTASKPATRAAKTVVEDAAGAAAVAPSSGAEQPPAGTAATATNTVAEPPPPRSGGAGKKKCKARKRVTHVTVDTNVMD